MLINSLSRLNFSYNIFKHIRTTRDHHIKHLFGTMSSPLSYNQSDSPVGTIRDHKDNHDNLILLIFIHRHGERAPLNLGAKDPYNDISYWPEGFGNLDNAGRLRMYKLGQFIRKRYSSFLGDDFREVYSRSSDVDRCIESAQALMAGMYPPTDKRSWDKQLPWVPTPVHSVPPPEDYILNEAGEKYIHIVCQEMEKLQSSERVKKLYEESVAERKILADELGLEIDHFVKFKCAYSVLDIEYRNGLKMPTWYDEPMREKLYRYAGLAFAIAGGGTHLLKKTRNQHLLADIVKRMENCSSKPKELPRHEVYQSAYCGEDKRIIHYSTHDSILAALFEALNISGDSPVPQGFGATFFIEVYADKEKSDKYIKLSYLNQTETEKPVDIMLPGCELDQNGRVTVANFKEYISDLLPGTTDIMS